MRSLSYNFVFAVLLPFYGAAGAALYCFTTLLLFLILNPELL
jgi:hypothetical protein